MQRITPERPWPLFNVAATRAIEQRAAAALPPHALMQRAGLATARLALAIAPYARTVWVACGPGNNGGDGMEAALHLRQWGKHPIVTWLGDPHRLAADAQASWQRAQQAGVQFSSAVPGQWDLAIDALLGIGASRAPEGLMLEWIGRLDGAAAPVLAVDLPSGLNADTGTGAQVRASHTLSLLTLKPGLFTSGGRDAAGQVWLDDLAVPAMAGEASAELAGPPATGSRPHASHKGSYGDVAVVGGAPGMTGAALLAAAAALHGGAGRVFVGLLGAEDTHVDSVQPELMFRPLDSLDFGGMSVACGCGGGEAVRAALPRIISTARALVIDADGLNAIAADSQLKLQMRSRAHRDNHCTVLTPHPLEAARLLGVSTAQVQGDRLAAAQSLAQQFGCVAVLKGSGTVTAAPGRIPVLNPTGNARLATAGTGDVLAGMIAARLAAGNDAFTAARDAVYLHAQAADRWPAAPALTASALARAA